MNFYISNNLKPTEIDKNEEVVIIEDGSSVKKITLQFSRERFSDFEIKLKEFTLTLEGRIEEEFIFTSSSNYKIYSSFYEIFY